VAQPFRIMADDPESRKMANDHKAQEQARRAAALRENLRRRKAQARSRATVGATERAPGTHDSAGIGDDKH
jgi:hypothetical protein